MNDATIYRGTREEALECGDVPQCRECGQPSPLGDPCETCAEVERILSMSDDEIIAESSDEELGWARGFKEGLGIGLLSRGWQPIETAPKDGTHVVVYARHGTGGRVRRSRKGCFANVAHYEGGWGWLTSPSDYQIHPTHWRPLPAPPVQS